MGGTTTAAAQTGAAIRRDLRRNPDPPRRRAGAWLDRQFTRLAVLPTTVLMAGVFGIPLLFSLYLSFQGWSADQTLFGGTFAGLDNYEDLLSDPGFMGSLGITFFYTASAVAAELALGLSIALLLNIDLPWIGLVRTFLVVPMIITTVVAAFC